MRRRRVLPGFGLSLGTSVLFVSLVLLLPMTALVVQLSELTWAQYWAILTHPQTTAAFRVTILSAFWASVINALLGLLLAWILVRYRFPGRRLLDGLIDLPFVLPPQWRVSRSRHSLLPTDGTAQCLRPLALR